MPDANNKTTIPSAKELEAFARSAEAAARIAGKLISDSINSRGDAKGNGQLPRVESKGGVDLVTETDKLCEEKIIAALRQAYPQHRFVGEESTFAGTQDDASDGGDGGAVPTWYIDPVDGTTNFVHGYPFVAVSIGMAVRGEPVLGVIFLPMLGDGEMYVAWRGGGATRNGRPIRVGRAAGVDEALLMNNIGSNRSWAFVDRTLYRLKRLLHCHQLQGLRNSGSAAVNLAHVASGKLDVYYEDGVGGPWDWVAGQVLVEEAGGVVVGLRGEALELTLGKKGRLVAGNAAVVGDVVSKLKGADRRYVVRRGYDVLALASTLYVGGRLLLAAVEAARRRK